MKRAMLGALVVGLGLLVVAPFASAATPARNPLPGAKSAVQMGLVTSGDRAAQESRLIPRDPAGWLRTNWEPAYIPSPVDRFDWSAWFGWLGERD